jgi:uncharacterized lipoprotein YmbA
MFKPKPDLTHSFVIHNNKNYDVKHLKSDAIISINIAQFPEYLLRPEIVTKKNDSELKFYQLGRWILPLNELLQESIKDSLLAKFDNISVKLFPQVSCRDCNFHLKLYIDEFIVNEYEKNITLNGSLEVLDNKYFAINRQRFACEQEIKSENITIEQIVSAHNIIVESLSAQLLDIIEYTITKAYEQE